MLKYNIYVINCYYTMFTLLHLKIIYKKGIRINNKRGEWYDNRKNKL